jgi:hypothetical protein
VAPSGARRVDGDIGPTAGTLAFRAWLRVLRATATQRRADLGGFGHGERQRIWTDLRWPADVHHASARWSEATGGSHLWRPDGGVVTERHLAAQRVVASPHFRETERHPFRWTCRDVRIRSTARGATWRTWARPTTPSQAPLAEGSGERVGQRWFATGAGSPLETVTRPGDSSPSTGSAVRPTDWAQSGERSQAAAR